jgi:VWFA-related protein
MIGTFTRLTLWFACPLAGVLVLDAVPAAQSRFRVGADAVRVDVLVTDGRRAVQDLTASDFELRDEGILQRVGQIQVERVPLNVIYVFDTSGSVAGSMLQNLVTAGVALLDGLQERDRVALLSFANRVHLVSSLTGDRGAIRVALASLRATGRTTLRDGLFAGLALRETDPARTLLLLFTDGRDTASWLPADRVIEAARRTDVVVYPVAVRSEALSLPGVGRKAPNLDMGDFVHDVAEETGGRVVVSESNLALASTFTKILAEFRDRYVLTYAATGVPVGGWHRLEVKQGKKGKVTARRGYFAE